MKCDRHEKQKGKERYDNKDELKWIDKGTGEGKTLSLVAVQRGFWN